MLYYISLRDPSGNEVSIGLDHSGGGSYPPPTGGFTWTCTNVGSLNIPDFLYDEKLGVELVGFQLFGGSTSMIFYYMGNDQRRYNVFQIFEPQYWGEYWNDDGDCEVFPSMGRRVQSGLGFWTKLFSNWRL